MLDLWLNKSMNTPNDELRKWIQEILEECFTNEEWNTVVVNRYHRLIDRLLALVKEERKDAEKTTRAIIADYLRKHVPTPRLSAEQDLKNIAYGIDPTNDHKPRNGLYENTPA